MFSSLPCIFNSPTHVCCSRSLRALLFTFLPLHISVLHTQFLRLRFLHSFLTPIFASLPTPSCVCLPPSPHSCVLTSSTQLFSFNCFLNALFYFQPNPLSFSLPFHVDVALLSSHISPPWPPPYTYVFFTPITLHSCPMYVSPPATHHDKKSSIMFKSTTI